MNRKRFRSNLIDRPTFEAHSALLVFQIVDCQQTLYFYDLFSKCLLCLTRDESQRTYKTNKYCNVSSLLTLKKIELAEGSEKNQTAVSRGFECLILIF